MGYVRQHHTNHHNTHARNGLVVLRALQVGHAVVHYVRRGLVSEPGLPSHDPARTRPPAKRRHLLPPSEPLSLPPLTLRLPPLARLQLPDNGCGAPLFFDTLPILTPQPGLDDGEAQQPMPAPPSAGALAAPPHTDSQQPTQGAGGTKTHAVLDLKPLAPEPLFLPCPLPPSADMAPLPPSCHELGAPRDGFPRGLRGLNNLGNTCFMNAVLQVSERMCHITSHHGRRRLRGLLLSPLPPAAYACGGSLCPAIDPAPSTTGLLQILFHAPLLRDFFLGHGHTPACCARPERDADRACLCCEMDALFSAMYSGERSPYSPTDFLQAWWSFADNLSGRAAVGACSSGSSSRRSTRCNFWPLAKAPMPCITQQPCNPFGMHACMPVRHVAHAWVMCHARGTHAARIPAIPLPSLARWLTGREA